jgi:outer membrane autotransporter protein
VERRFGKLTLGFMGGLGSASAQVNQSNAKISSDSWHLGLYMSTPLVDNLFADTMMFYGQGENVITRTQNLPYLDQNGDPTTLSLSSKTTVQNQEWLVQLGVGAQLAAPGSSWSIVPSLRFAYAGVSQGAATEKMSSFETLGIKADAASNTTILMRTGLEVAKDSMLGKFPVRTAANAVWVHDFSAGSRLLGVRWQGAESAPWSISTEQAGTDVLRVGGSVEMGVGERRTLRLYGEQEFLNATKIFRGGVSFTIGF